ncbi:uncharacterized protein C8A04DRAFT_27134 [Dichotomopilus funicola]|uniref:Uncharacterized protein n=1 Tax=Dichotomopilus funicola TaxID=1934379 RepID=A0AAN6ZP57_9PEZI|nr:hypothetical protein C8A04DRAFT_27134 [Dichotomopilus funicola]
MAAIPGSYPDSIPPTPDETMQQQQQQQDYYGRRQRNKLHKPGDPRGQAYGDEHIPNLVPNPVSNPATQPRQQQPPLAQNPVVASRGPGDVVGGDTTAYSGDYLDQTKGHSSSNRAAVGDTTPTQQSENDHAGLGKAAVGGGFAAGVVGGGLAASKRDEHGNVGSEEQESGENSNYQLSGSERTPYWGSLPSKGGGVYNTVVGHGSQDDETRRQGPATEGVSGVSDVSGLTEHAQRGAAAAPGTTGERKSHWHTGAGVAGAAGLAGAGGAAALSGIPENEKQKQTAHAANADPQVGQHTGQRTVQHTQDPRTGTSPAAPGFLPETAAGDDARLAAAASRGTGTHLGSDAHTETGKPAHRAFPLTGPGHTTTTEERHQTEQRESSPSKYGTAAAGAAGLAAGAATAKYVGKRRSGSAAAADRDHTDRAGDSSPQRSSPPVEKTSSNEEEGSSPKGEKKHRILGLFHRRKESKNYKGHHHEKDDSHTSHHHANDGPESVKQQQQQQPETTGINTTPNRLRKPSSAERRRSPDYRDEQQQATNNSHNKEKSAAGAAAAAGAGAGAYGLWNHHRNQKSVGEKQQGEDITTGANDNSGSNNIGNNNNTLRGHQGLASAAAATGVAGPAADAGHRVEKVPAPLEHSRGVPASESVVPQSGVDRGSAGYSGFRGAGVNEPSGYNSTQNSGVPIDARQDTARGIDQTAQTSANSGGHGYGKYGAIAAGTAAAAAVPAAYEATKKREVSNPSHLADNTRQVANNTSNAAQTPGHYDTLATGMPSSVKHDQSAGESGLASGQNPAHGTTVRDITSARQAAPTPEYNVLPSGTASGVKVKPHSPHHSQTTDESSGIASSDVSRSTATRSGPGQTETRSQQEPQGHSQGHGKQYAAMGLGAAVVPAAAYTASSSLGGHQDREGQGQTQAQPQGGEGHGYDQYSHAQQFHQQQQPGQLHQQTQHLQQPQQQPFQPQFQHQQPYAQPQSQSQIPPQPQQQTARNPALAAATTSWTSNAGKSSGVPVPDYDRSVPPNTNASTAAGLAHQQQQGGFTQAQDYRVSQQGQHFTRCQHCGGENDISEHVQRLLGGKV